MDIQSPHESQAYTMHGLRWARFNVPPNTL